MQRLMAAVAFGSVEGNEVNLAAQELERAGYTVFRLPAELRGQVEYVVDDFLEAQVDAPGINPEAEQNAMGEAVKEIVDKHRGMVIEWGRVGPAHEPFSSFFPDLTFDAWPVGVTWV
jgi:hypothetical protein